MFLPNLYTLWEQGHQYGRHRFPDALRCSLSGTIVVTGLPYLGQPMLK
jgi:hypothetical protein